MTNTLFGVYLIGAVNFTATVVLTRVIYRNCGVRRSVAYRAWKVSIRFNDMFNKKPYRIGPKHYALHFGWLWFAVDIVWWRNHKREIFE